jgi:hypothetical protein
MMWWRLSAGSCLEGNPAVSFYVRPKPWILDRLREDLDRTPEGVADSALKRDHTDQVHLGGRIELNGEVNVAFGIGIAAGDGTEQGEATDTGHTQFRLVRAQCGDYMLG